jgi:hypothetical protein
VSGLHQHTTLKIRRDVRPSLGHASSLELPSCLAGQTWTNRQATTLLSQVSMVSTHRLRSRVRDRASTKRRAPRWAVVLIKAGRRRAAPLASARAGLTGQAGTSWAHAVATGRIRTRQIENNISRSAALPVQSAWLPPHVRQFVNDLQ